MGGRGGGVSRASKTTAPSGPPRPTPLQTALEFARSFQPPRPVEPAIPPAQVLQRLLEPIQLRLDTLMQRQPSMNLPINITQPPINIRQPDILVSPPNVSINQRFPDINIQTFPNMEQHRDHNRQHVADLPDAPLVQPNAPLVLAGPMRMDDPHEDVPLNQVDPALVLGKYEAKEKQEEVPIEVAMKEIEEEQEREPVSATASDRYRSIPLTYNALNNLYFKSVEGKTPPDAITLQDLARKGYGLKLSRELLSKGKPGLIDYLLNTVGRQ